MPKEKKKTTKKDSVKKDTKTKKEVDTNALKPYCGIKEPVPRGYSRAGPEYCANTKQIRYYGTKKISEDLIKMATAPKTDIVTEQLKLRTIQERALRLIKEAQIVKIILSTQKDDPKAVKRARAKMEKFKIRRDKLKKQILDQRKYITQLENEDAERQKLIKASNKKAATKTVKKISSGSKTKKPRK